MVTVGLYSRLYRHNNFNSVTLWFDFFICCCLFIYLFISNLVPYLMEEVPTLTETSVVPISQLCMFATLLMHAAVEMASTSYATIFILGSIKMGESIETCTRTTIIWELKKCTVHLMQQCKEIIIYRVSQEEWTKLRESVPYVELYRYNPKHLCPKLNGYGDNGQRSLKL